MVQDSDVNKIHSAGVSRQLQHVHGDVSCIYKTASPLNGAVNERVAPPFTLAAAVVTPVAGLNHSTDNEPEVAERLTVAVPPLCMYTRYSASFATGFARQYVVEHRSGLGDMFTMFMRKA